jgi:hypothetical protein
MFSRVWYISPQYTCANLAGPSAVRQDQFYDRFDHRDCSLFQAGIPFTSMAGLNSFYRRAWSALGHILRNGPENNREGLRSAQLRLAFQTACRLTWRPS